MKPPDLLQFHVKTTNNVRLQPNEFHPSLENQVLAKASSVLSQNLCLPPPSWAIQTSTSLTCPALQATSLSSTTSKLLSSTLSSFPTASSLLSTKNSCLKENQLQTSSTCFHKPFLSGPETCTASALHLPEALKVTTSFQVKQEAQTDELSSSEMEYSEETVQDVRLGCSEEDGKMLLELPVLDEEEQQAVSSLEDFEELEAKKDDQSEDLKYRKYKLLNFVCCSLASKSCSPGQKDWDEKDSVWSAIKTLATVVTSRDPEFLLKVAIYTRQELNIRVTANFLLALAAHLPESKPHFRRYFCPAIQLPSDWLEVIRIYSTCFSKSLPSCLKKGLSDKFKEFSEYQLAKYNTRKHRCKHQKRAKKGKQPSPKDWKTWGDLVRVHESMLQKYLQNKPHVAVDKKQTEFSLKKMIKRLHIKESAEHVMAILGKKYPSDLKAFSRSGLSGVWDRERAGKRMKLKQPDTWEHKLSQEGNKAATWEKLIDGRSLPFMAMLRNLRNMISVGISQKHHAKILSRLTSKDAVIKSRQFPFRFLSAYKVIMELSKFVARPAEAAPSSVEIVRDVLKKLPKSKHYKLNWDTTQRKRLKVTMRVPFIYRLYNIKRNLLRKANQRLYTRELLDKYCVALEKAVQISCKYNIPPLPGRTLVLCSSQLHDEENWSSEAQELCLPPDCSEKEEGEDQLSVSVQEVAMLLSMMIKHCSEDCQVMLTSYSTFLEVKESSENLLENVKQSIKLVKKMHDEDVELIKPSTFFTTLTEQKTKFDRIVVIESDYINSCLKVQLDNYRKNCNCNAVLIYLMLVNKSSANDSNNDLDSNAVQFSGFTEQVLKFVSERGSSRMLQHIDNIDKIYSVPPPQGQKTAPQSNADISPLMKTPKLKWRGVRVFISSTFRDMHSERDVLVCSVFPELRRRAAPHFLYLQEVELRWGVTEEESNRTVELCLSEVCRSQLLLGILGERYGLVPPRPSLPSLPQYSWLESAPPGLSVTEMEIRQFEALFPDSAQSRMLFYFRSPRLTSSVPVAWRPDFVAESKEAEAKMNNLKTWIRHNEFKVTENYPCEWGGVVDGKPSVKGLEEFAKTAMEDIWETIEKLFVEEADEDVISEIKEQELHQEAQHRQFHGRAKLVSMATDKVKECQQKGGVLLIDGNPGDGKTVFMAALAQTLKTAHPLCDVISYSTDASQSACSVDRLLRCLVQWLRKRTEDDDEELLSEFHLNLSKQGKRKSLALLVDGADRVHDGRGQWASEWIPQLLPKGVCLVLSVRSESSLQNTISRRKSTVSFPLGLLSLPDKKEIVQKELVVFGKKLSDSAFNNQLQTLLMKKGSVSPLYLHLACEELRNYASFDTMKETLQALPQSLCELVQHSLLRLESQYGGVGLGWALSALTISSVGLRESALYSILNLCNELNSRGGPRTWMEVLPVARCPEIRVPMAVFSQLARTLHSIIGASHGLGSDDLLILRHPEVKAAFERLYLSTEEDQTRSHLILAAYLWTRANPQGNDMFLHSDSDSLSLLPTHLMAGNQQEPLCHLLSNYYFLYANVRHGLLHQLLEVYIWFDKKYDLHQTQDDTEDVKDRLSFLKRHSLLFSQWPALFVQTALNEPDGSSARAWAENATRSGRVHVLKWKNNEDAAPKEPSEQVSTFCSTPSCVVVSPDEEFVVVGTEEGTLHFVHAGTGQEVKTLVSSGDGISGCLFLGKQLITTSFDGQIEVWDAESGCRTTSTGAHSNKITGCDASPDSKHFATVSLDFSLKVWSVQKNKEVVTLQNPTPLNCVTFDLEGHLLAVGCWGGAVRLWNWLEQKNVMTLCGHLNSVRSLSFSPCSSMLSSGCVSGEVRLWSVAAATCVGRYQAHCGSTQSLNFLQGGNLLLSSGQDCVVQVWSGGLGRSVAVLEAPYQKQIKPEEEKAKALCVAVSDGFATVGYHGDGIKMFNLVSEKKVWSSDGLQVSMLCVLWVKINGQEFVLSGGFDHHLRVWERPKEDARFLVPLGCFGVQKGAILAMSQNATHFATASDDFTIALWLKRDLASKPWVAPGVKSILRGHNGGVTCLAFSPDGQTLLSGGKDQALIVWKVSSSPVLSKSFPHCHGDWITGCAWTSSALLSCSSDCKLRMWDVQTGSLQREILFGSSLSSLCCWEEYVMAGSADGLLMVWKWENGLEVTRIQAHASRVHHCTVVPPSDQSESVKPEDLLVASASEDGTIKLWHPLQVQHHSTLHGHSAEIQAVVCKQAEFLTVSSDRSLRSWSVSAALETPYYHKGKLKAVCFLDVDDLLACCYSTGRLEIWKQSVLVYFKKVGDSSVSAVTGMPDAQLAIACIDCSVSVWKLELDSRSCIVGLEKVSSYTTESPVSCLLFCSLLFGACVDGTIVDVASTADSWTRTISDWSGDVSPVGVFTNDCKSFWLMAVHRSQIRVGFVLVLGTSSCRKMAFCETLVEEKKEEAEEVQPEEEEQRSEDTPPQAEEVGSWITAAAIQNELIVCGDSKGNMWFNQTSNLSAWTERRPAHTDRVSVLKITESLIISASYDRTIKLWDRHTKKQLGMFVCGGPVLLLEFNPRDPRELVCGDTQGQLYFLSWKG